MKTTLVLREDLLERAMNLTRIKEKSAAIHAGLEVLIAKRARERLAKLGDSDPKAHISQKAKTR